MATRKAKKQEAEVADKPLVIVAYKGFDKNMQCRGYQFEIGKTFEHSGPVIACESGFHACENPLGVWSYYAPADGNRFCEVELSGEFSRHEGDSKIAAATITVKAEIGIPQIVSKTIEWAMALVKGAPDADTASGYYSKQAASGNSSTQAASGNSSTQAASGYYSKQAASGDSSKQAASGNYSTQEITGRNGVAVAAGEGGRAKAAEGGCFALRWDDKDRPRIAVAYVGENGIKADTWYEVDRAGNFVEAA